MNKILVFVPTEELVRDAEKVQKRLGMEISVELTSSKNVLDVARRAHREGAMVAVARGHQAHLLKQSSIMPMAEIVLSGQDLARMIHKARRLAGTEHPVIGFVGYQNMFSDLYALEEPLGVRIIAGFVNHPEEIPLRVRQMQESGVDILIGGTMAIAEAQALGMRTMFIESSEDSMLNAVKIAQGMLLAMERERENTQEIMALLNYSLDAIVRVDRLGRIRMANYMAEKIFKRRVSELIDRNIGDLFDMNDADPISQALTANKNTYATFLYYQNVALVANVAAISGPDGVEGAILSMQEFKTIDDLELSIRQERYFKGHVAEHRFDQLTSQSRAMNQVWEDARRYAKYDLPVLLRGELGTGKHTCAECIHNASMRKKSPFVTMDCAGMPAEVQNTVMLGHGDQAGLLEIAHTGTIYLNHIEQLDAFCQYQLLRISQEKVMMKSGGRVIPVDVRILCGTDRNLYECVQNGTFNEQLYCLLSQLEVNLLPLSQRREDLANLVNDILDGYSTYYRKYITLTEAARARILSHDWQGNLLQLKLFLEKLIIVSEDKLVDEENVLRHLPTSFRREVSSPLDAQAVVYTSPEADDILRLLVKHNGNRSRVAEEMGVSKSTLWRKIKKYGIEQSFHHV